jgi:predicted acylesterase/phospholipase RssA
MARRFRIARIYRPHSSGPEPLRVAIVLSGAVALGSFEAGVVYEVLSAVARGAPLMVDVVVGSSAGGMVGALAAKCLVTGAPFEQVLPKWTEFTLQELTSAYQTAEAARAKGEPFDQGILSSQAVRMLLDEFLVKDPVQRTFQPAFPAPRMVVGLTLTNLDGLRGTGAPDDENRFTDAVFFRFTPPDPGHIGQSPFPSGLWQRIAGIVRASSAFPGAFDPERISWAERIRIPGLLEEVWENEDLLKKLHDQDPTLQPLMRYADGGILDEQPVERAISVLPLVTGGEGEAGPERLVYDPRRCFLFIEPDPPATSADALKAGTPQTWFSTFTRALRLWSLSASPHTSQRRVSATNKRQEKLLRFLADFARRIRESGQAPSSLQALENFRVFYPEMDSLRGGDLAGKSQGEVTGPIDPKIYRQAIRSFYRWLADSSRFNQDMEWLEKHPPGRVRDAHNTVRVALADLREAYLALEGVDPVSPGRYQAVVEEVHAALTESLGLSQPWVALHPITPEDPRQMLQGEEMIHFGGFFAREFLRHDFLVGRYYAYLWLKDAVPDHVQENPVQRPPATEDGINWRLLWRNRGPLWRMAGRLMTAMLEAAGLSYGGAGQVLVKMLGWALILSAMHGLLLLTGAWFGWITFPPQYQQFRFWLLMGTSLFPLTFGLILGLVIRGDAVRAFRKRPPRRP